MAESVWIVMDSYEYEGDSILGVYGSEDTADAALAEFRRRYEAEQWPVPGRTFWVEHWEVDNPDPVA